MALAREAGRSASPRRNPLHVRPGPAFPQMPGHLGTGLSGGPWRACAVVWGRPAPAWAQRREAAPSRGRSGRAYVQLLAPHPALWPGPSTPQHRGQGGLGSSLMRIRSGAGQTPSVTDALPSLDTGQGGNILCSLLEKSGRKIRLRSYTQNLLLFLQKLSYLCRSS